MAAMPAIVVTDLSKRYHAASARLFDAPTPIFSRRRGRQIFDEDDEDEDEVEEEESPTAEGVEPAADAEVVWAVSGISFTVPAGTALALVGPPSSGKSTLLRILAGAAPPTAGRATVRGVMAPLVEVATHFMPPAEPAAKNVVRAGVTAGIPKKWTRQRLEEIFDFAGVPEDERRHGGTRRPRELAISTALNIGADIIPLIDPATLVAPEYRDRCLERLEQRRREGRTILLETDDLELVERFCDAILWLDAGSVVRHGTVEDVLPEYEQARARTARPRSPGLRGFNRWSAIASVSVRVDPDESIEVDVVLEVARAPLEVRVAVALAAHEEDVVRVEQLRPETIAKPGLHPVTLHVEPGLLRRGHYVGRIEVAVVHNGHEAPIGRAEAFALTVDGAPGAETVALGERSLAAES